MTKGADMNGDLLAILGALGGVVVTFVIAFFTGKREGRHDAIREVEQARLDQLKKTGEVDDGLAKKSNDDIRIGLNRWVQRDGD